MLLPSEVCSPALFFSAFFGRPSAPAVTLKSEKLVFIYRDSIFKYIIKMLLFLILLIGLNATMENIASAAPYSFTCSASGASSCTPQSSAEHAANDYFSVLNSNSDDKTNSSIISCAQADQGNYRCSHLVTWPSTLPVHSGPYVQGGAGALCSQPDGYYYDISFTFIATTGIPYTGDGFTYVQNCAPKYVSEKVGHISPNPTCAGCNPVFIVPIAEGFDIARTGDSCPAGSTFNASVGECNHDEQKGASQPIACVADPINTAVGNSFQTEQDYTFANSFLLSFYRSYNSLDGIWRHNYSTYLRFSFNQVSLIRADGRESFFGFKDSVITPSATELGSLVQQTNNWLYTSETNEQFTFDTTGRLITYTSADGKQIQLTYAADPVSITNDIVTVTDQLGQSLTFTEDYLHQPLNLTAPGLQVTYTYDANSHLSKLTRTQGGLTQQRQYLYEDTRNNALLTGIIDERGIKITTWAFDDQGRAISNQHIGGAGNTLLAYNPDGSTTVTNELGKNTVYSFLNIGGIKRVSAIKGEPSPNCPASNSSYTYDSHGQVLTKTDAKGFITTYTYNDRGLETSRTEASGTSLAKTTTTTWDPSRFLPTQVVEPNRTTVYSYDAQGRQISQVITPR